MLARALSILRARWVRAAFVVVALAAAAYAVWAEWHDVVPALGQLSPWVLAVSLVAAAGYLALTMLAWRMVLADLGSPLGLREAFGVFFVGQLGKYVPGGVWNFLALSELGADRAVPRRRSLSAMVVALLVAIVSGLTVGIPAVALGATGAGDGYWWLWICLPVFVVLLTPPVMNRVLDLAMRLARQEPLEHPLTTRGILAAVGLAILSWVLAGLHVWLIGADVGLAADGVGYLRATGAYAVAWVVGFLVVMAPAGLGAREAVLLALLAGAVPNSGAVLVIVLVSRIVLTVADILVAAVGFITLRSLDSTPTPH